MRTLVAQQKATDAEHRTGRVDLVARSRNPRNRALLADAAVDGLPIGKRQRKFIGGRRYQVEDGRLFVSIQNDLKRILPGSQSDRPDLLISRKPAHVCRMVVPVRKELRTRGRIPNSCRRGKLDDVPARAARANEVHGAHSARVGRADRWGDINISPIESGLLCRLLRDPGAVGRDQGNTELIGRDFKIDPILGNRGLRDFQDYAACGSSRDRSAVQRILCGKEQRKRIQGEKPHDS
jgi:hypothetical protein